jgi:predicted aconitase with swiveling domain
VLIESWSNTGQILVKHWPNTGQICAGRILVKQRGKGLKLGPGGVCGVSETEHVRVESWSNTGQTLVKHWSNTGQTCAGRVLVKHGSDSATSSHSIVRFKYWSSGQRLVKNWSRTGTGQIQVRKFGPWSFPRQCLGSSHIPHCSTKTLNSGQILVKKCDLSRPRSSPASPATRKASRHCSAAAAGSDLTDSL